MKRISMENFTELVLASKKSKHNRLRSVHNYDILTNPLYSDRFCYVPCTYPKRSDYTISDYKDTYMQVYSSDIVRLVCDLAYMPID